eukprot:COSAG02_NODE_124_length_35047_cov_31.554179_25_plen_109_part_00
MVASQSIIQRFHAAVVEHRSDALHAPPFPNPSACPEGLLPASCRAPLLGYLERLRACLSPALQLHNCACTRYATQLRYAYILDTYLRGARARLTAASGGTCSIVYHDC